MNKQSVVQLTSIDKSYRLGRVSVRALADVSLDITRGDFLALAEHARQRPDQLSGGQRQRVAIARAMARDPKLVIADGPTANLDSDTGARILDLLGEINTTTNCTFVFSTHDPALMARAGRVVHIRDGRVDRMADGGWQMAEQMPAHHLAATSASAIRHLPSAI